MSVCHSRIFPDSMKFECPRFGGDVVDMHRPIAALSGNIFIQGVPSHPLNEVVVFGNLVYTFALPNALISVTRGTGPDVPSLEVKMRAQLSVLPAMMYSPVGLHAKS